MTSDRDSRPWLRFASAGFEVALSALGFTLLGLWLDRHFGWRPWGTLSGAIVGIVGGLYNLVRAEIGVASEASEDDRAAASKRDSGNTDRSGR